jgi:hypothetical protein
MTKIEQRTIDFLDEIKGLNDLYNNRPFTVNLNDDQDFKYRIITNLYEKNAIISIQRHYGKVKSEKFGTTHIVEGANLDWNGTIPKAVTLLIRTKEFELFYKQEKQKLEDLTKCYYKKGVCILEVNNEEIPYYKATGLILYFLYLSRIHANEKDYNDYNSFLNNQDYCKNCKPIRADSFRRTVDKINERTKRMTNGYIKKLIKKGRTNKYEINKYKFIAKIN